MVSTEDDHELSDDNETVESEDGRPTLFRTLEEVKEFMKSAQAFATLRKEFRAWLKMDGKIDPTEEAQDHHMIEYQRLQEVRDDRTIESSGQDRDTVAGETTSPLNNVHQPRSQLLNQAIIADDIALYCYLTVQHLLVKLWIKIPHKELIHLIGKQRKFSLIKRTCLFRRHFSHKLREKVLAETIPNHILTPWNPNLLIHDALGTQLLDENDADYLQRIQRFADPEGWLIRLETMR